MLEVCGLSVSYPERANAVDGVCFALCKGEKVAIIGANGAGKTTLLLALAGILAPSKGNISIEGVEFNKRNFYDMRREIGLVFQNPDDQLFMPNIYEDAAFGPRNLGCSEEETRERVENVLGQLGILRLAQRSPLKLSGGEKRLAAIATVLTMRPSYMLFDEPTAFLDPRAKRVLVGILSELPQGKLIATHDLAFAEKICSRVLLLRDGKLAAEGGIDVLRDTALLESAGL
ncbi:MAG: energy-coupling factor ABC transporter ATP-binding protein [Syntrophomonadaceae bacterium]|jgi:cobalt/nickel transport system ATP-binding protein|nr:energy-coupling factor ABC transporter ATP-binding protein [Syntrophomonadaceae bacterium]